MAGTVSEIKHYNFLSFDKNGVIIVEKEDFSRDKIEEYKQEYLEIVDNLINNRKDTTTIGPQPFSGAKIIHENSLDDPDFNHITDSNSDLLHNMLNYSGIILTYNIYVLFRKKGLSSFERTPEDEILLYNENGLVLEKVEAVGPISSLPVHVEEDLNTKEFEEFKDKYTIELNRNASGIFDTPVVIASNLAYVDDTILTTELKKENYKTKEFVSAGIQKLVGNATLGSFSDLKEKIYRPDTIITPNQVLAESMEVGKLYYGFHLAEAIGEERNVVETATYNARTSVVMLESVKDSKYTWENNYDLLKVTTLENQGIPTFDIPTKYDTVPNEYNIDPVNDKAFYAQNPNSLEITFHKKAVYNDAVIAYPFAENSFNYFLSIDDYPNETKQVLDKYLPKYKIQVTDTLAVPFSDFKFGAIMYPFIEVFKETTTTISVGGASSGGSTTAPSSYIQLDYPLLFTDLRQDSDGSWSCEVRYYRGHLEDTGPWRVKVEINEDNSISSMVSVVITDPSFYNLPLVKKENISAFEPTTKFIGYTIDKFISVKMSGRHILEAVDTDEYVPGLVRSKEEIYHYYKLDGHFATFDNFYSYPEPLHFEEYIAKYYLGKSIYPIFAFHNIDRIINKTLFELNIPYIKASKELLYGINPFDHKILEKEDILISEFNFTEDKKMVFEDTLVRKDKVLDMLILKKYRPEWFEKLLNGDKEFMDAFVDDDFLFTSSALLLSTKEDRRDVSRFFASYYYKNNNRKIMSNEEYLAKKRDNSFTKEELFLMENFGYVGE